MCKGQLLCAVGRDGNNQMFPIAWAVVSVENKENWGWFLNLLKYDLSFGEGAGLTIISDMQKVSLFVILFCPNSMFLFIYVYLYIFINILLVVGFG